MDPLGAGDGDWMLPWDIEPCDIEPCDMVPPDIDPPVVVTGAIALAGAAALPGDRPGAVSTGAFDAPLGAGAGVVVCAQAIVVVTINAAEASQSERM